MTKRNPSVKNELFTSSNHLTFEKSYRNALMSVAAAPATASENPTERCNIAVLLVWMYARRPMPTIVSPERMNTSDDPAYRSSITVDTSHGYSSPRLKSTFESISADN